MGDDEAGRGCKGSEMDGIAVPQVELGQQPETTRTRKSRVGLIAAVLVAVVAVGVFAAAFVWVGGVDGVARLVGPYLGANSGSAQTTGKQATSGAAGATGQSPTSSSDIVAPALPPWAQSTMYEQQLTSQPGITSLVNGNIERLVFSSPVAAENGVQVPLEATYRDGRTPSGTISLLDVDGAWFFAGIDTGVVKEVPQTSVDAAVVSVITKQQTLKDSQEALKAFSTGDITGVDVMDVTPGTNTASVNVVLRGGAYEGKKGRFVCVKKVDGIDDYWFVTGFSWQ